MAEPPRGMLTSLTSMSVADELAAQWHGGLVKQTEVNGDKGWRLCCCEKKMLLDRGRRSFF